MSMETEVKEPAVSYQKHYLTPEEYLAMEEAAGVKHEYYNGEVFAMAGATVPHNTIIINLLREISNHLKHKPCKPFGSDQGIYIEKNGLYTYPDISIVCGKTETHNNRNLHILNPSVIIEVLSQGTKSYDRGEKFRLYRGVASMREYILIDSEKLDIEAFAINEHGFWELKEYTSKEESLFVKTINLNLPLTDIYDNIEFDTEEN